MKFIPYDKLSKKKKRELDRRKRGDWGGLSPVTRRAEKAMVYKRERIRPYDDGEADPFCRLQNKVLLTGQ